MDATKLQPSETPNDRCKTSQQFGLRIPNETTTNIGSRLNRHGMHPVLGLLEFVQRREIARPLKSLGFVDTTEIMTVISELDRYA